VQPLRTDDYGTISAPPDEGPLAGLKGLLGRFTRQSVMEPGFKEAVMDKDAPIDYSNIGSVTGGRLRQMVVDPVRKYADTMNRGLHGEISPENVSIKDLLAMTELGMEMAGGGVTGRLAAAKLTKKGLDPNMFHAFPAWHGSGANIPKGDRFRNSKIGTGEGAQAFGWGHYFTDLKGIASDYARKLGGVKQYHYGKDRLKDFSDDDQWVKLRIAQMMERGIKPEDAKTELIHFAENAVNGVSVSSIAPERLVKRLETARNIDPTKLKVTRGDPHLYKTTVHKGKDPSEYDYLNWHKPVNQQTGYNLDLKNSDRIDIFEDTVAGETLKRVAVGTETVDGQDLYQALARQLGSPKEASMFLLDKGVDGIKYDAGTLSGGRTGAKNYVVFDPKEVTIDEHFIDGTLQ